jgi:hypothetical protein
MHVLAEASENIYAAAGLLCLGVIMGTFSHDPFFCFYCGLMGLLK